LRSASLIRYTPDKFDALKKGDVSIFSEDEIVQLKEMLYVSSSRDEYQQLQLKRKKLSKQKNDNIFHFTKKKQIIQSIEKDAQPPQGVPGINSHRDVSVAESCAASVVSVPVMSLTTSRPSSRTSLAKSSAPLTTSVTISCASLSKPLSSVVCAACVSVRCTELVSASLRFLPHAVIITAPAISAVSTIGICFMCLPPVIVRLSRMIGTPHNSCTVSSLVCTLFAVLSFFRFVHIQ
jgi:hypothetical protein